MSTNAFRRLIEMLPQPTLLIAQVLAVHSDNTSTVQYPDGSQQRVRGTSVAVGQPAFVREGKIDSLAPAYTAIRVDT